MKRLVPRIIVLCAGVTAFSYYTIRASDVVPEVRTVTTTRGDIVETIGATGTLEAVTTVQVGSQVSGTIAALYADYNSIVRAGDVIARLDPSLFETQVEQARASLTRAEADADRLFVTVEDTRRTLTRTRDLADRNLVPVSELEAAEVAVRSAEAQLKSAQAQVTQAEASLHQTEVNLGHTVITAPIDGIVISRSVDVGQTVSATMSAPELFLLAADLSEMRVLANIDESDVGRIQPGQPVTFQVDAYPTQVFDGHVSQVRLAPVVVQNVVTYMTVIDAPNADLQLKPGMTATVTIEVERRDDVVGIPNAALRFRPSEEELTALGQAPRATETGDSDLPSAPRGDAAGGADEASTRVWAYDGLQMSPVAVTLGMTNGLVTEVVTGDLGPDIQLVTAIVTDGQATSGTSATSSPLIPQRPTGTPRQGA